MRRVLLGAAAIAAASLFGQEGTKLPAEVQAAGKGLLAEVKELEGATFATWMPLYAPATQRVAFWEGRLRRERGGQSGYAIFRTDGRLMEFRTAGEPATQRLLQLTEGRQVKLARFGPHYLAAFDERGTRVASTGVFPRLVIDNSTGLPFTGEALFGGTRDRAKFEPREFDQWRVRVWASEDAALRDYVTNYEKWFEYPVLPPAPSPDLFGKVNNLMDPNPLESGANGATTDGGTQSQSESFTLAMPGWRKWDQLKPNDSLNTNKGFASGCGGQSYLTLFNWHAINMTPQLLSGDPSDDNYPATLQAMYMNGLRDWLGTFESFGDQGATWPWNMTEGVDYARFQLNHHADWVMSYAFPGSFDSLAGKMVRDMVAIYGKPMIIGYTSDIHYDVVREVRVVGGFRQFFVDFDGGKWVGEMEVFFAGGAFDFRSVANAAGYNHGFEHGMNGWYTNGASQGGLIHLKLRDTSAHRGTGYVRLEATGSKLSRVWKRISLSSAAITHAMVTVRLKTHGAALAWVSARDTEGKPAGELPNGPILASAAITPYGDDQWHEVTFQVPFKPEFNLEVQMMSAPGLTSFVDVDTLEVRPVFKQQPPPKQPCILGKPGLDEGCDF